MNTNQEFSPTYTLRITNPELLEEIAEIRNFIQRVKNSEHQRPTRKPGLQIAVDIILQLWNQLTEEERLNLVVGFKTRVMGYQYSEEQHPGQWVKGHVATRPADLESDCGCV